MSLLLWGAVLLAGCSSEGPLDPDPLCQTGDQVCFVELGPPGVSIESLQQTPWGLVAGTKSRGVLISRDMRRWDSLGLEHAVVSALEFIPGDPDRLLAGVRPEGSERTEAAVFALEDPEESEWIPWDDGIAEAHDQRSWAFSLAADPDEPRNLFMGQWGPVQRSGDGGATWSTVFGEDSRGGLTIHALEVRDEHVWAGGETSMFGTVLLRSHDGGDDWTRIEAVARPGRVNDVMIEAGRPDHILVATSGEDPGVHRSTDDGATWERVLAVTGGVVSLDHGDGILYAVSSEASAGSAGGGEPTTQFGLYASRDGGVTWTEHRSERDAPGARALEILASGEVAIGTEGGGVWLFRP